MKKYPKFEATRAYNADGTKMQCKHIPDLRILEFLYTYEGCNIVDWRSEGNPTSILYYQKGASSVKNPRKFLLTVAGLFPTNVPQKLIRAKLNSLQSRGLIEGGDGSPSGNGKNVGSRFDVKITQKGKRYVESITHCDLF